MCARRWYDRAPNMVVYFFGIVVVTKLLEATLTRYCAVYRDHMSFAQRRRFITHMWGVVIDITGFTMQCVAYMPELFTGAVVGPHKAHIIAALSCIIMVGYMHDLAYTVPSGELLCHHLSAVVGLVVMVFALDESHNVQLFLMFSTILILFETLSAPSHIAMLLYRLWASPVAHPVRSVWAGRFMLFTACWSVFTKLGVHVFAIVRYIQVARLGPGAGMAALNEKPVSQLHGETWFRVMVVLFPAILTGFAYSHFHTWIMMFKLGLRYCRSPPSSPVKVRLAVSNV